MDGIALTMTMRTPGDDVELAAGLPVSEAVVRSPGDIAEEAGLTLAGFLHGPSMNVYTGAGRLPA